MRFLALALLVAIASPVQAFEDELLDRLAGDWVMRGTIAGEEVVHDVSARWILAHHYLQFTEVSRETDESGNPAYEAQVTIGWDEATQTYACLWLDVTGGEGLSNGVIGRATREGDSIPFVFGMDETSAIHNTFVYDSETDTWRWVIDNVREGRRERLADVTLDRQ
jgi:hypothetical protein